MFIKEFVTLILFILIQELCAEDIKLLKYREASKLATSTVFDFFSMFHRCVQTSMSEQRFLTDDLKSFVNYPSKTTVGFAPKFTSNRKFFANMISTKAFKEMLARDEEELRRNFVKKLKFCDETVLDQDLLRDFYDREVDQSKI